MMPYSGKSNRAFSLHKVLGSCARDSGLTVCLKHLYLSNSMGGYFDSVVIALISL